MNKTTRNILIIGALGVAIYLFSKNRKVVKQSDVTPPPPPPPPPIDCVKCGETFCDEGFSPKQVGECGCQCVKDVVILPPPQRDDDFDITDEVVEVIDTPNYDGFVLHASNYGFVEKGVLRLFTNIEDFKNFFKESLGKDFSKVINVTDEFFNSFPKGENMPSTMVVVTPTDEEPLGGGGIEMDSDSGIGDANGEFFDEGLGSGGIKLSDDDIEIGVLPSEFGEEPLGGGGIKPSDDGIFAGEIEDVFSKQ